MLSEAGYKQVEGFGGIYDDPEVLRDQLDQAGLTMPTGHFDLKMIEDAPKEVIRIAHSLVIKALFIPYLDAAHRTETADDWFAFSRRLEEAGKPN